MTEVNLPNLISFADNVRRDRNHPPRLSHSMLLSWTGVLYPGVREQERSSDRSFSFFQFDMGMPPRIGCLEKGGRIAPPQVTEGKVASSEAVYQGHTKLVVGALQARQRVTVPFGPVGNTGRQPVGHLEVEA